MDPSALAHGSLSAAKQIKEASFVELKGNISKVEAIQRAYAEAMREDFRALNFSPIPSEKQYHDARMRGDQEH